MLRRRRSSNLFSIDHTMRNRRSLFPTYMFILTMILVYGYNVHKMQDEVSSKIVLQVSTTQRDGNEGHKKLIAMGTTTIKVGGKETLSAVKLANRDTYTSMIEATQERRQRLAAFNYSSIMASSNDSAAPIAVIMTDPPGRTGSIDLDPYLEPSYVRVVIIVTISQTDCKLIKSTIPLQCLQWPRLSPSSSGGGGELESHLEAHQTALEYLFPKPKQGLQRKHLSKDLKYILFTSSIVSVGVTADKYNSVGKSFFDGLLLETSDHPEATIVGATWVENKRPYRIMNTGFSVEWDYKENPYVRSLNAGYRFVDEEVNPVLVSPVVMLVPVGVFSRNASEEMPQINRQPGLYRHIETICSVKDTIVTIELLTITAEEVFDVVLSSEDAPRDFLFQATSLKSHLQRVRGVAEQLDLYIQSDSVSCRLTIPTKKRSRDLVLMRLKNAENLQRTSQKLALSCVSFNDGCKVKYLMNSLETQLVEASSFMVSSMSSIASWKSSAGFAPLDQPGSWSFLFNLTFGNGFGLRTSSSRVYCCNFKPVEKPQTLPFLKELFAPLQIDTDSITDMVIEEPSRYILSQDPMEALPVEVYEPWKKAIRNSHSREQSKVSVVWSAWCCQCCGFSQEWAHYLHPLEERIKVSAIPGPECHCNGLTLDVLGSLQRSHVKRVPFSDHDVRVNSSGSVLVWISHTPPTNFLLHKNDFVGSYDYFVGRSMYEFSALPASWAEPSNSDDVNEIWVPSNFVRNAFIDSGIKASKLVVMPEGIDCKFYDPDAAGYLQLPSNIWAQYNSNDTLRHLRGRHVFLSIFKWEPRKGGDVLIRAFINEFTSEDKVTLVISTYRWYPGSPETWGPTRDPALFQLAIEQIAASEGVDPDRMPHIVVITENLSEEDIRDLYAACHTFVLPTRGEGWGLPIIQAMSMGMPTISTAWGGAMAFMNDFNSFPLKYRIVDISSEAAEEYQVQGVRWAEPDSDHLRFLMREMLANRSHAIEIGKAARADVVVQFSEPVVADMMVARLKEIEQIVIKNRTGTLMPP
eukprot:TRINITY_DN20533_c0_g1_i2.p1 TRINITY_DN20533_c0_g1~~TRINITY_DN20533_c0_g1_i2.p1  ORF type:complete len:1030 (+),score=153.66 TRINITY_DN20533_c0_g1_i2:76-3165(+)